MAHLYILKCIDRSYYIGSTNNLKERLNSHRLGKVRSTKFRLPMKLVYQEYFRTKGLAQTREYQIKSWKDRKAIERLINKARSSNGRTAGFQSANRGSTPLRAT